MTCQRLRIVYGLCELTMYDGYVAAAHLSNGLVGSRKFNDVLRFHGSL